MQFLSHENMLKQTSHYFDDDLVFRTLLSPQVDVDLVFFYQENLYKSVQVVDHALFISFSTLCLNLTNEYIV